MSTAIQSRILPAFLLAALLAVPALPAQAAPSADGDWLVFTLASRHHKRGYNERNWGIGAEYGLTEDWRAAAGTYRNSFSQQTFYAGAMYLPLRYGDWRIGGAVLAATGYDQSPVFLPFPVISYERKEWGFNLGPILPTVVGVQIKFRY